MIKAPKMKRKTPKYTAKILQYKKVIVDYTTGNCLPMQPTAKQIQVDQNKPQAMRKYMAVDTYSDLGTVTGNTLSEIQDKVWAFSLEHSQDQASAANKYMNYTIVIL